jgi:hypothetical protein
MRIKRSGSPQKKNYKAQFSTNIMLKDEIEKKINLKEGSKAKKKSN